VFLSAVKLLQVKKDRDWVFLYLISFFEVLLAAGLSFSPVFLGTLTLYLLCGLSAVTAFEIQKARRSLRFTETRLLVPPDSLVFKKGRRFWRNGEAARRIWTPVIDFHVRVAVVFDRAAIRRRGPDAQWWWTRELHRLLGKRSARANRIAQTGRRSRDACAH
jgi:hypothetical protein